MEQPQVARPLDGAVLMERLRLRHIAEDDELGAEVPFERWSDLTRTQKKMYKKQHERHLAACQASMMSLSRKKRNELVLPPPVGYRS